MIIDFSDKKSVQIKEDYQSQDLRCCPKKNEMLIIFYKEVILDW